MGRRPSLRLGEKRCRIRGWAHGHGARHEGARPRATAMLATAGSKCATAGPGYGSSMTRSELPGSEQGGMGCTTSTRICSTHPRSDQAEALVYELGTTASRRSRRPRVIVPSDASELSRPRECSAWSGTANHCRWVLHRGLEDNLAGCSRTGTRRFCAAPGYDLRGRSPSPSSNSWRSPTSCRTAASGAEARLHAVSGLGRTTTHSRPLLRSRRAAARARPERAILRAQ